jgi:acyl-CoA dehydrogenase
MDFAYPDHVQALCARLQNFMEAHVWPATATYEAEVAAHRYPEALLDGLKAKAKAEGLWNLFLPGLQKDEPGTKLTNLEYAPLAEIMGRLPWASEVFNCAQRNTRLSRGARRTDHVPPRAQRPLRGGIHQCPRAGRQPFGR